MGKQKRQCGRLKGMTVAVFFSKVFLGHSDEERDDWSPVYSPVKGNSWSRTSVCYWVLELRGWRKYSYQYICIFVTLTCVPSVEF